MDLIAAIGIFCRRFCVVPHRRIKQVESHTRRNLRDLLRKRVVYLPKGRNKPIDNSLFAIVPEELPWPDYDSKKPNLKKPISADTAIRQEGYHMCPGPNNESLGDRPSEFIEIRKETVFLENNENTNSELMPHWKKRHHEKSIQSLFL